MFSTGIFTILGSGKFWFATIFNFLLDTEMFSSPQVSCADLFCAEIPAHIAWPSSAGEVGLSENPLDPPFLDHCHPRSMVRIMLPPWRV